MINFEHNAVTLKDAFKITQEESEVFEELMQQLNNKSTTVSWTIQRVWIDERLSDNARAYAIFTLGRYYEFWHYIRGLPGTEN